MTSHTKKSMFLLTCMAAGALFTSGTAQAAESWEAIRGSTYETDQGPKVACTIKHTSALGMVDVSTVIAPDKETLLAENPICANLAMFKKVSAPQNIMADNSGGNTPPEANGLSDLSGLNEMSSLSSQ